MIQPRDLRIGNLIECEGQILPILAIDSDNEYKDLKGSVRIPQIVGGHHISNMGRWIKDINPIPLSEEWLIRLGFIDVSPDKNGMGYRLRFENGRELAFYVQDGYMRYQSTGSGFTIPFKDVKYVHQLQNLYFALTGSELTIDK